MMRGISWASMTGFLLVAGLGMICVSPAQAVLSLSNGNFQDPVITSSQADVKGWCDYNLGNVWDGTWQAGDGGITPNGTVVSVFSALSGGSYLYQSIGTTAETNLTVEFDFGSPNDDPGGRALSMTVAIYAYDGVGSFVAGDNVDIGVAYLGGGSGLTLLDSVNFQRTSTGIDGDIGSYTNTFDISSAGSQELFLSFKNEDTSGWPVVDNVSVLGAVPPPVYDPYTNALVEAEAFGLDRVRLLDSRFEDMQELHRTGYLEWLEPDRLLYPFRSNAGLSTEGSSNLGGWEADDGFTRGHMAGHYLSGASKMYASTGDTNYMAKIQYMVDSLRQCQDALAVSQPVYGYLSAFPSSWFDGLETDPHGWNNVPFYTIHKILAGLVDAYKYCGIDEALDIAIDMSDYHSWRVSLLSAYQIDEMFQTYSGNSEEWGGMNETLTDLYLLSSARDDTNAVRHLEFGKVFDRDWFVTPLSNNEDILAAGPYNGTVGHDMHANTHVPQVVGFAHLASVLNTNDTERARLYTAADNFWHMVTDYHSFVIGGNSFWEYFNARGLETGDGGSALRWDTAETCNTYNMLKLTGELMQHRPNAAYADYYEQALYNHILASISPETGMFTYFVSLKPGHFKTYCQEEGSCWCCTGSGIENPSQYGQYIYLHKDNTLWVNLYIPSTLDWDEQGMSVQMETDYPESDTIQLTISNAAPVDAKVRLRIPGWISEPAAITVNGATQDVAAVAGSYAELDRTWNDGDVITLVLPMGLRLDRAMDDETQVSIFYGPVLLGGGSWHGRHAPQRSESRQSVGFVRLFRSGGSFSAGFRWR